MAWLEFWMFPDRYLGGEGRTEGLRVGWLLAGSAVLPTLPSWGSLAAGSVVLAVSTAVGLAVGAALSALTVWYLGGWWFVKRLDWSTDERFDEDRGRRLNVYLAFLFSGMVTLMNLVLEVLPLEPMARIFAAVGLFAVAWTLVNWWSWRTVRRLFPVRRRSAALWFLGLPLGVVAASIALAAVLASFFPVHLSF